LGALSIGLFAQAENYSSKLYKIKEAEDEANRTCNHKEKKETWQEGIGNSRQGANISRNP
jgi:hypothetical protein